MRPSTSLLIFFKSADCSLKLVKYAVIKSASKPNVYAFMKCSLLRMFSSFKININSLNSLMCSDATFILLTMESSKYDEFFTVSLIEYPKVLLNVLNSLIYSPISPTLSSTLKSVVNSLMMSAYDMPVLDLIWSTKSTITLRSF